MSYHPIIINMNWGVYECNKLLNSEKIADKNTIVSFLSTLFSLRALLNYQKTTLDVLIINFVHSLLSSCATQVPFICLMIKRNDNEEAKVLTFSHISPINQMHFSSLCKIYKKVFCYFSHMIIRMFFVRKLIFILLQSLLQTFQKETKMFWYFIEFDIWLPRIISVLLYV